MLAANACDRKHALFTLLRKLPERDVSGQKPILVRTLTFTQIIQLRRITSWIAAARPTESVLSEALFAEAATYFAPNEHPALAQIVAFTELEILDGGPPRIGGDRRYVDLHWPRLFRFHIFPL